MKDFLKLICLVLALFWGLFSVTSAAQFDAVRILPRQEIVNTQAIRDYQLETSDDGATWTLLKTGTFDGALTAKTVSVPGGANVRHVRLTTVSTVTGASFTALAEFDLMLGGTTLARGGWTAAANSAQSGFAAALVLDGDPATYWHTPWSTVAPLPHTLSIDTGVGVALLHKLTLAWDPNPESDISSYALFYGATPGVYTQQVVVPASQTGCTVDGLAAGLYYFAMSATNTAGKSSPLSTELAVTVPFVPPPTLPPLAAPTGLRIVP